MRRVDALITAARTISRNSANADGTFAITDNEILQYLNDAQDRMQNLISTQKNISKIFTAEKIISIVAGQEAYTIPDRLLLNKQIENVEFSATGSLTDYVRLQKCDMFNRDTNTTTYPSRYYKRGGQIFLQPTPSTSTGSLRVIYERDLDDLDIPRGIISTVTNGTTTQFDTLTLANDPAVNFHTTTPGWDNIQYFCVSTIDGARRCYNILRSSYNSGTKVVTPSPSPYIFGSQETTPQVGDICTFNKYTTTFSQLPDACERYLIHYAAAELFHRDSSNDHSKEADILAQIETDILRALSAQTSEVQYLPQLNTYEWY